MIIILLLYDPDFDDIFSLNSRHIVLTLIAYNVIWLIMSYEQTVSKWHHV